MDEPLNLSLSLDEMLEAGFLLPPEPCDVVVETERGPMVYVAAVPLHVADRRVPVGSLLGRDEVERIPRVIASRVRRRQICELPGDSGIGALAAMALRRDGEAAA